MRIKNGKIFQLAFVAIASAVLVVGVSPAAAQAADDTAVIIGYDDQGNPVYEATGADPVDPDEVGAVPEAPTADAVDEPVLPPPPPTARPLCDAYRTVNIINIPNKLEADWTDAVINNKAYEIDYTVTAETTKQWEYTLSGSATTSVKAAVFGQVEVSVNGSVARTKSTRYGSTITIKIKGKGTTKVDRGMWLEKFNYAVTSVDKYCRKTFAAGTGKAPYREAWKVY